jgi:hypothetical protein
MLTEKKKKMPSHRQRRSHKTGRRYVVGGKAQRMLTEPIDGDDGSSALEIFLYDYRRINYKKACTLIEVLHVWVYVDSIWKQWSQDETADLLERARMEGRSACTTLLTNIFKLDERQFNTMHNSFLSDNWHDFAGLYQKDGRDGEFTLVVREPVSVPYGDLIGLPIAGALSGLIGSAVPLTIVKYKMGKPATNSLIHPMTPDHVNADLIRLLQTDLWNKSFESNVKFWRDRNIDILAGFYDLNLDSYKNNFDSLMDLQTRLEVIDPKLQRLLAARLDK